ncbi:MAG: RNase-H-2 domain-containing protein [Lachnoclostridium sp.]|jgi:uncharacterized protein
MKTFTNKININPSYPVMAPYDWKDILFFDIETTGFSSNTSYLYLIGCMYYKDKDWQVTQWLADDLNSEPQILEAFFQVVKSFKRLIHYNGTGFDIPFIQQKCKKYNLNFSFDQIESYDIYKKIQKIKRVLPLSNYKLKTIEKFLGIKRTDTFSGEDLIQIYANYLGKLQYEKLLQKSSHTEPAPKANNNSLTPISKDDTKKLSSEELSQIILLHNLEDVKNLIQIADILYYLDIFENCSYQNIQTREESVFTGQMGQLSFHSGLKQSSFLCMETLLSFSLPQPLALLCPLPQCDTESGYHKSFKDISSIRLLVKNNMLTVKLPVFDGELKYFFENYKDYYYLPMEDTAIHKSVAMYVDKDYKVKAKPANCYIKKQGRFLPQTECIITPEFKFTFTDKLTYFELTDKFFSDPNQQNTYVKSILRYILNSKAAIVINDSEIDSI